jgi:hypothetical protein
MDVRMCFNRKVLAGLAVGAVVLIAVFGWGGARVVPALLVLACPISMIAMMAGMRGGTRDSNESDAPTAPASPDEVARLRAEIAELRQRQAGSRDDATTGRP